MLRRPKAFALSAALVGLVAVTGMVLARAGAQRPDCPGKIICPQTGELICRDKCPTVDPSRPDCPGRIVCPQTGELVCEDRCALGRKEAMSGKPESKAPSCCARRG